MQKNAYKFAYFPVMAYM